MLALYLLPEAKSSEDKEKLILTAVDIKKRNITDQIKASFKIAEIKSIDSYMITLYGPI